MFNTITDSTERLGTSVQGISCHLTYFIYTVAHQQTFFISLYMQLQLIVKIEAHTRRVSGTHLIKHSAHTLDECTQFISNDM